MKLTGHTVLITGGGTGLGSGLAKAFHEKGNKVIITGRREQTLKELASQYPGMEVYAMDVANEAHIHQLYDFITKNHPNLDTVINNAGIMQWPDFSKPETLGDNFLGEIEINLKGLIRMTAVFLPHLLKQKEPTLINVSSGLAYVPLASSPVYCATKAAVHSFSDSLRYQLRHTPVRVIEVAPPGVETELGKTHNAPGADYPRMKLDVFVSETMKALASGKNELPIGQAKALKRMGRFFPSFIFNMINPAKGR
jgi:uncharacterized oxidoreductase